MTLSTRSIVALAALLASSNLFALSPVYIFQTGLGSVDIWKDSDSYYYLTGAGLFSKALSDNSIFDLQAEISTYEYSDNEGLSSEEIFLQGTYSYTPRAGFRVPTYSIAVRYLEEFVEEDRFDASTLTMILSIDYRIDDRTSIRGGLKAGERDTDLDIDSDIGGYFVNLDFLYSPEFLLYTTVGLDEGAATVRSYCSGGYAAGNKNRDDNWWDRWASRYDDCENLYLALGANYTINSSNTLDFSATYYDYDASFASFDGFIYAIDYFYRF